MRILNIDLEDDPHELRNMTEKRRDLVDHGMKIFSRWHAENIEARHSWDAATSQWRMTRLSTWEEAAFGGKH